MDRNDDGFGTVTYHSDYHGYLNNPGWGFLDWNYDARGVTLTFSYIIHGFHDRAMARGTMLDVRLDNETVVSFATVTPANPYIPVDYGTATGWDITVEVTTDDANRLASAPWLAVRIVPAGGEEPRAMDIRARGSNRLVNSAACLAPMARDTVLPPETKPDEDESVTL